MPRPNNPKGTPENLIAAHPGNTNRLRHGIYSENGALDERTEQVTDAIMAAEHTVPLDEIGAVAIGRTVALLDAIADDLAERGLTNKKGEARSIVNVQLSATRRLAELLDRFGLTPRGRAEWARQLAEGESLAQTIKRKKKEAAGADQ
jgi:hypothetical protein